MPSQGENSVVLGIQHRGTSGREASLWVRMGSLEGGSWEVRSARTQFPCSSSLKNLQCSLGT